MSEKQCTTCGSSAYETRQITYLYSHQGKYLIVPNTPVEVCQHCGTVYYSAAVLKRIEQQFCDIHSDAMAPDDYLQVPMKAFG